MRQKKEREMEFREAVMRVRIHKKDTEKDQKQKWRISFHKSSPPPPSLPSSKPKPKPKPKQEVPKEFLCPISGSLMNDPVIVSSGHTFERACVQACNTLSFTPSLADGRTPDFSAVIPNLALKSAILNWCKKFSADPPKALDFFSAEKLVRIRIEAEGPKPSPVVVQEGSNGGNSDKDLIIQMVKANPSVPLNHAVTEITRRPGHFYSSSDESVGVTMSTPPLQFTTRPSCCSSVSSSSELEGSNPNLNPEEEEFLSKLKSSQVFDIEEGLTSLRKITRTKEETRTQLCTPRLLSALRPLIVSRYTTIQVNSVACLVNLSLAKVNKVKIVRTGIVPLLIDVLKGGYPEAQEHACGATFSLALDDRNKTAIGVLGALPPLLHLLRSESERTRHDSAMALYHLSLVQSNRTKLVKLGSVPVLLGMVKSGHMTSRVLLVLCNLAYCADGRAAILDSGGVECLVGLLREGESETESTRESCVSVLFGLSYGGLRFKGLAKVAGAMEVLVQVEKTSGSERSREKARRIIEMMKRRLEEEEEEMNWEELLGLESTNRTRSRLGSKDGSCANSSGF